MVQNRVDSQAEHVRGVTSTCFGCKGAHVSHLLLLEVTQGLHHDRAAALLFRVARFQPDDGLRFVDQTLDLPLVVDDALSLFLRTCKGEKRGGGNLSLPDSLYPATISHPLQLCSNIYFSLALQKNSNIQIVHLTHK